MRRTRARSAKTATPDRRSQCVPTGTRHDTVQASRRHRILKASVWIAASINVVFAVLQLAGNPSAWWISVVNLITAALFMLTPRLCRYGDVVGPLAFLGIAYAAIGAIGATVGTASGMQFYFLVSATIAVLILGGEHIALAAAAAGVGAGLAIALQFIAPDDTGIQPPWLMTVSFVFVVASACFMVVAIIWFAGREIAHAEAAMEAEYERSESLLTNILPPAIAERLKDPATGVIADSYDDASIMFADIAHFTERASQTAPGKLVVFLNRLYTDLDRLTDRHGLEKIKTTGDSYMVVSGVPNPRADHLEALARLALDIADTVAGLHDPLGQPLSLRIGLAAGPVVAGVVGARRFFYDVWGDAVNLASRMESTDNEGRIQVPQDVYERLKSTFVFEERGKVNIKGKGVMRTWFLIGERPPADDGRAAQPVLSTQAH
ncbi:MAG TPA: adenylate/guanylate cyclase domain-containing protein [Mycobacterium sp.]|nr:adenylate/guanylate cyclase domain-containing protein [Mycobacterium sp.]